MDHERKAMVRDQLQTRGIHDERVLDAMLIVPRECFVPERMRGCAYEDRPLSIGCGQTISQPYIVAMMLELLALEKDDVVLDVGTGSGYMAALLAHIVRKVYSVELEEELTEKAQKILRELGFTNVEVRQGDGYSGWPDPRTFSGIVVSCAPNVLPLALLDQLAVGARLVIPVGPEMQVQQLMIYEKLEDGRIEMRQGVPVRFVPMRHG